VLYTQQDYTKSGRATDPPRRAKGTPEFEIRFADPKLPVANVSFMAPFPLLFGERGIDVQREFVTV
jgi:hypothetical protein